MNFSYYEGVLFLVSTALESQRNLSEKLFIIFSTSVSDQIYRHYLRTKTPIQISEEQNIFECNVALN